jgi:hypothetical protein
MYPHLFFLSDESLEKFCRDPFVDRPNMMTLALRLKSPTQDLKIEA